MIQANNPNLKSWIFVGPNNDFPIQNLPFGIFRPKNRTNSRACSRIGNYVVDLSVIAGKGYFRDAGINDRSVFLKSTLNEFIEMGRPVWQVVRAKLSEIFDKENEEFWNIPDFRDDVLFRIEDTVILMPVDIKEHTAFYSGAFNSINPSGIFYEPENKHFSKWRYFPAGYNGRGSSVVISGTPVRRPTGQIIRENSDKPVFCQSEMLDIESGMGFIVGKNTKHGERVSISNAQEHIFGLVLANNITARDIQKWEQFPFGSFLSKNTATVISPWIVTLDSLEPFRANNQIQKPEVLPYLRSEENSNFDINLEVFIQIEELKEQSICSSNMKYLYWNIFQLLTHLTSAGCKINVGDIVTTGAIGEPKTGSGASLLEMTSGGTMPVKLLRNSQRTFLQDYDTIVIKGFAEKNNVRIGFDEARTRILPME